MNLQRENMIPKRSLGTLKSDENSFSSSTSSLKSDNKQPLQDHHVSKKLSLTSAKVSQEKATRRILSDKHNSKPLVTTTTTTTKKLIKMSSKKDTQLKEEFFNDNETRYKAVEEDFIDVVPILPILVPKRLHNLYKPNKGIKRTRETETNQPEREPFKTLFVADAPALQMDINKETQALEHLQETKAKLAMLRTTASLKEHQWNDPMMVAEYAGEIFGYLYESEPKSMADPTYAHNLQHEVSWKMRSVLVDWVIEIHYLFSLLPETLFLAVNIIDRFLSLRTVVLSKLQLVGITSLYIATKFEEMLSPNMQDFLFMTDNAVKEDELIKAERFILQVLDFHLCYPNPMNFLRRVCTEELKCDIHTRTLAKYFMEITCIDHRFIGVRPSQIAAASLWLSKKMLAKGKWTTSCSRVAGYTPEELKETVEAMLDYLSQPVTHDAFFKKWSSHQMSKASIFVRDWINRYYIN